MIISEPIAGLCRIIVLLNKFIHKRFEYGLKLSFYIPVNHIGQKIINAETGINNTYLFS